MHDQVRHVIMKTERILHDGLQTGFPATDSISDITQGKAYRDLRASVPLKNDDLTLTLNTDGSPVFSSSGASVWPIQFLVNELPVPERFKHCTVAGLWFGKGHPNMALFIHQFVDSINDMTPVVWKHEGIAHTSRAYVLCWCLDAPARAAVQNCILFNGYMGCPYCLTRGEHLDGCLRYVNLKDTTPRTPAGVLRDMEIARELGGTFPINGYFGPSPTVNLPHFNLVWGFTVEYMHAVLLGVAKQVTEMQLSSSNSQERYYIGSQDPSALGATGRRPSGAIWLLYYWLPSTLGILPEQYWLHVKKLVEAIHILLSSTMTAASVDRAETLLRSFVSMTGRLYGATSMTYNVHQLWHLPEAARQMGPLWAHSAFVFEGGNGRLVKLSHVDDRPFQVPSFKRPLRRDTQDTPGERRLRMERRDLTLGTGRRTPLFTPTRTGEPGGAR
ncbi:hypothetical protein HPB47_013914 [Ixodes persulcatus]|uniref:Uncharacterized protein n=1 Tax=Ixodes persulcatus TaxID=34615 RepID=A0AC60QXB2_IXOPE|nr:hypothetical protein HPB47_013914 [Ixodes persulcatus]